MEQTARLFEQHPQGPGTQWVGGLDLRPFLRPRLVIRERDDRLGYFSRYLLALHSSPINNGGALITAIDQVRCEARKLHRPPERTPTPTIMTDNGSKLLTKRFQRHIEGALNWGRYIRYRTPQQLEILERSHYQMSTQEDAFGISILLLRRGIVSRTSGRDKAGSRPTEYLCPWLEEIPSHQVMSADTAGYPTPTYTKRTP